MKNRRLHIVLLTALMLMMVGCNRDEDPVIPTYIHLDKVSVTHNSDGTTSMWGDSWLTYVIDAVQIELWFKGEDTTTQLGTFELPCTVPVLTNKREIEKIQVYPFVKQNGIAATHIPYPFYEYYTGRNYKIAPDSVTNIGVQNGNGEWEITVPYRSTQYMDVKMHEFFEPQQMSIALDSNATRVIGEDARSGLGFGRVKIKADQENKTFFVEDVLTEHDASSFLYLEMDYRADMKLAVGMEASFTTGGATSVKGVVTLYPTGDDWVKMYINLGRTWRYFNYSSKFRICFSILNEKGIDGKVDLDNLKVLSL